VEEAAAGVAAVLDSCCQLPQAEELVETTATGVVVVVVEHFSVTVLTLTLTLTLVTVTVEAF